MSAPNAALVALLLMRAGRMALALAPRSRWRDLSSMRAARLELPHTDALPEMTPQMTALTLSESWCGCRAQVAPTRWTYGPSQRHLVDRTPALADGPFLRFDRMLPGAGQDAHSVGVMRVEVYRATTPEPCVPDPALASAIVWLTLAALKQVVAGVSLGDTLALEGVEIEPADAAAPPETFLYLPSDYGERHLLRIAAKYGEEALFAGSAGAGA